MELVYRNSDGERLVAGIEDPTILDENIRFLQRHDILYSVYGREEDDEGIDSRTSKTERLESWLKK